MIHYLKHSKSLQNVVIHYIFSRESLCVVNSLQIVNSLRVLFLVCRGPLGEVCGVSTWPSGCDTPSPFSERFFLGEHAQWGVRYPPPNKKGISATLARYPMKERHKGATPPSAILSRKGIARHGGVSRTGSLRGEPNA